MTDSHIDFDRRVQRLSKKHGKLARGYRAQVRKDGLVVMKPQRHVPSRTPLRVVLIALCAFFAFKAFLLATIGSTSYDDRVERLRQGTPVEQAGAWVMQSEPVSEYLAAHMTRLMY